jgi:hypothetical protein
MARSDSIRRLLTGEIEAVQHCGSADAQLTRQSDATIIKREQKAKGGGVPTAQLPRDLIRKEPHEKVQPRD